MEHQSDQSGLHEQIQVNTASEVLKTVWEINKKNQTSLPWKLLLPFLTGKRILLIYLRGINTFMRIFLFRFVAESRQLRAGINLSLRCRERICLFVI